MGIHFPEPSPWDEGLAPKDKKAQTESKKNLEKTFGGFSS
jgi:hypothetical protein